MSRVVVKKGDLIMREQPLVLLQTLSSRKRSLSCNYCMADIGNDWRTQADMIIALHKSPSVRDTMGIEDESLVFAELDSIVDVLIAEGYAFGCPHRFGGVYGTTAVHSVVCRDVYCSLLCQQTCLSKWHMLECCSVSSSSGHGHTCGGGVLSEDGVDSSTSMDLGRGHTYTDTCSHHVGDDGSSTSSMMHDFTAHASRTNEIFFAVRRVLTTLISYCTADHSVEITCIDDVIDWFLGCFPLIATDSYSNSNTQGPVLLDKNTLYEMSDEAEESWLLLVSALISEKHVSMDRYGRLLSRQCFSQILFIANQHLHSLVINVSSRSDHSSVATHLLNYLSNRQQQHYTIDGHSSCSHTIVEAYMEKLLAIGNSGVGGDVAVREALRLENTLNLIADLSDASSSSSSSQPLFPAAIKHTGPVCMVLLTQCSKASRHSCLPNAAPCLSSRTHLSSDGIIEIESISWEDDLRSFLSTKGNVMIQCRGGEDHNSSSGKHLPSVDVVALRPFVLLESAQTSSSSDGCFIHNSEHMLISYIDHTSSSSSDANAGDEDEDRYSFSYRSRWTELYSRTKMVNTCYCSRCRYEEEEEVMQKKIGGSLISMSTHDIITLAHFYMQQAAYSAAKRLYYRAIHRIETTPPQVIDDDEDDDDDDGDDGDDSSNVEYLGDAYHALGAVYLECMGGRQWEMSRYVWMRGAAAVATMKMMMKKGPRQHALLASEVDKIGCYPSQRVHVMKAPTPSSLCIVDASSSVVLQGSSEIISCCNRKGHTVAVGVTMKCSCGLDYSLCSEVVSGAVSCSSSHQLLPMCVAVDSTVYMTNDSIPLLSGDECAFMVREAESYCASVTGSGWSTSRHYGVPTTDIPVHCLRERCSSREGKSGCDDNDPLSSGDSGVLSLFNDLFSRRLAPMLATHFPSIAHSSTLSSDVTDSASVHVAIHDAFIVKYASSSPSPSADAVMGRNDEDSGTVHSGNHRYQNSVIGDSAPQVFLPLHTDQSSHSFIIPLNASSEYTGGGTYFPSLDCILRPGVGQALFFPGGSVLHGGQPITAGTRYILAVFAYMSSSLTRGTTSDAATTITSCQLEFDRECGLSSADIRLTDDDLKEVTTRSMMSLPHDTSTDDPHRRVKRPRVCGPAHDVTTQEDHSSSSRCSSSHESSQSQWMGANRIDTYGRVDANPDDGKSTFTFGFSVP